MMKYALLCTAAPTPIDRNALETLFSFIKFAIIYFDRFTSLLFWGDGDSSETSHLKAAELHVLHDALNRCVGIPPYST